MPHMMQAAVFEAFGKLMRFADGKVRADIEFQPLSAINDVFDRLGHGRVPSRVVLGFGAHA